MKKNQLRIMINESHCDFAKLAKNESDPRVRVRLLGLQMFRDGSGFTAIGKALGFAYITVKEWVQRFSANGLEGLKDLPGRGQKPLFPMDQKNLLAQEIEALQQQKNGGRITGKDIQKHLLTKWGLHYKRSGTYNLMEKCGIVWITGRSKHPKSDLQKQEEFKKNLKVKSHQSYLKMSQSNR
jgi:transposase